MRIRTIAPFAAAVALAVGSALLARAAWNDGFPHDEHAGLFPLCAGCHAGVPEGNPAEYYPEPESCLGCHDGQRARRVSWTGPSRAASNLRFDHPTHDAELAAHGEPPADCGACHTPPGGRRMDVERAVAERCFACHAHAARDHYVDAACATCHVPLAQTGFERARIEALPRPATHKAADFLARLHGELAAAEPARCATCHTREQCAGCHVDVPRVAAIGTIPAASAGTALPPLRAEYPVPASHLEPAWLERHGAAAAEPAACSTCHTRESCATCHEANPPRAVVVLPRRAEVAAPGATTERRAPESHASAFFATQHGALAASRRESCATCHSPGRFCQACHQPVARAEPDAAPRGVQLAALGALGVRLAVAAMDTLPPLPRPDSVRTRPAGAPARAAQPRARLRGAGAFHPTNYLLRHAAEAYNRRLECSSCHDTRLFCRDCHVQAGFGTVGRLGRGFHDAEPVWLLRHGQAARQTLESCATCHAQRDCMQCHSQLGSFQVNPHGPGFDARRAQQRNARVCFACHLSDPLGRRTP